MSFFISPSLDARVQDGQILAHHPVRQRLQWIDGDVEHVQLDYSAPLDEAHQVLADIHSLQLSQHTQLCRKVLERVRRHVEVLELLQPADEVQQRGKQVPVEEEVRQVRQTSEVLGQLGESRAVRSRGS